MRTLIIAAVLLASLSAGGYAQTQSPTPNPSGTTAPVPAASGSATPGGSVSPAPAATTLSDFARARIDTMLRTGQADAGWFSASFLAQVSVAQVNAILAQIKAALGAYQSIDGAQGDYIAHFEKGTDEVLVHLDADNKMNGLFFKPPKAQTASLDDALRSMQRLGGTLSYVLLEGRSQRAALNPSQPLAVGSAFKLAVLAAIRDEIARGRLRWTDVVPLESRAKSLPSGVLRTWPDGTPITLATYAAEMISISDNTAADVLVRLAGPPALRPYAIRNEPFLTTRELFILKSASGSAQAVAFLAARSTQARNLILQTVDAMALPAAQDLTAKPMLDIEWRYSVRELCNLIGEVAELPLMSINPGVADPASFAKIAFKGGSDTGVINLTTQVTSKRGTTFCLSATLNDPAKPTDDSSFELAYGSAINALGGR